MEEAEAKAGIDNVIEAIEFMRQILDDDQAKIDEFLILF